MSLLSTRKSINSRSSRRGQSITVFRSKKSQNSESFSSFHGSSFGRTVLRFPKQNDPGLVLSVPTINSRVIQTFINFPVKNNSKLPDLTHTEATDCIRELGSFMNILDYEFNFTSFWLLDILSKLIKHMQLKGVSVKNQNLCLSWFRFVLRLISISGDNRENIFNHLQKMFLQAEECIKSGNSIPQPEDIEIVAAKSTKRGAGDSESLRSSKSLQSISSSQTQKKSCRKSTKSARKPSSLTSRSSSRSQSSYSLKSQIGMNTESKMEINMKTLYSIIEIIYNVFADRFMFLLIHQTYSSPTIVTPVEIPIEFKEPKLLRPTIIVTPPMTPTSKKTSASKSGKKGKDKGNIKRKGSPKGNETNDKDVKSKKKKSEERDDSPKKVDGKGKGAKKKSKTGFDKKEEATESKNEAEVKGKGKGGKTKKKSKSSDNIQSTSTQETKDDTYITKNSYTTLHTKASTLEGCGNIKKPTEDKLKLFDKTIPPEIKLEMKKIEVKDKFLLPLSEGVHKGYVENLIKSLLPPESKVTGNINVAKEKNESKPRKSSSLKGTKKKASNAGKRAKGKKK